MMKYFLLLLSFFLLSAPARASDLTLLILDNNSYLANQAVAELDMSVETGMIAAGELQPGGDDLRREIDQAKVIIVDVMGRELENYLSDKINLQNKKIYALRGSADDERLKKLGFIFDDQVADYYRHISKDNIQNMLRLVANRHFDPAITFAEVQEKPLLGLYHPQAEKVFAGVTEYQEWQQSRENYNPSAPDIGLLFFASSLTDGQRKPVHTVIERLEHEGFNVLPCFGRDQQTIKQFLLDEKGESRVDLVLAFTLKFYSALTPELAATLNQLQVPIINAINLFQITLDQWRASPIGISGNEVAWSIAIPEISGLIEPTPLAAKKQLVDPDNGKTYYFKEQIVENIDRLMPRLLKLVRLQRLANKEKMVAIMFYNHHQGKQNVGASYLNVFRSLQEIIAAMAADGYSVGEPPAEARIKELILTSACNIGSWAPGELDRLLQSSEVIRLPLEQYKKWFYALPADFQENVIKQWGPPESSKIMQDGTDFIIPAVTVNNLILLPEPSRGWGDDPMKLYHDTTHRHANYLKKIWRQWM